MGTSVHWVMTEPKIGCCVGSEYGRSQARDKRTGEAEGRRILMEEIGFRVPISFLPSGKPVVKGEWISFSHSGPLVGMVRGPHPNGFDIQYPKPQILRVRDKFCHPDDFNTPSDAQDLELLTSLWTVKEAVFKVYGSGVNFKDIRITGPNTVKVFDSVQRSEIFLYRFKIGSAHAAAVIDLVPDHICAR